jgi:signal transduction histidine kinase
MSQRAREIVGGIEHLSDLTLSPRPLEGPGPARFRVYSWHFWRVWETAHTVVVGARPPQAPDRLLVEVLRLEGRLLRGYFRLVEEERRLGEQVRRQRGGNTGRRMIRQLEQERKRLGRDLHTGVGQALAAIRLQLELIGAEMPLPPPKVRQALENIGRLAADALDQVRAVSRRLHPPEWQRLTLGEAVRQLWQTSGMAERYSAELRIEALPGEPVPEVKVLIYRALQEALSNIVRHANATIVEAALRAEGERVVLSVKDNGVGFDVARLRAAEANLGTGIGLRSIREQVAGCGGNFDMESGPLGTKLVVSVPMSIGE